MGRFTSNSQLRIPLAFASLALYVVLGWTIGAPISHAQDSEATRTVEGRVVNGTDGVVVEPGLVVSLHQIILEQTDDTETATGPDGRFRIEDVEFDPQALYAVTVRYKGVLYGADIDLSQGSPPPIELTVYETADDQTALSVVSASLLLLQMDETVQSLWALEIVKIGNGSDRTYVPGPEPMNLLRFSLPSGALDLAVDTSLLGDVIQVDLGFALTASVPPGQHEVMYSYRFPYEGREAVVSRSYRYGVGNLRVLTPLDVADLASKEMGEAEDVMIGERPYHLLSATELPRGARISVSLTGLSQPSLGDQLSQRAVEVPFEYAAIAGLGVLMVVLLGIALWRRGGAPAQEVHARGADLQETERGLLVQEIARLEVDLEEGAIGEEPYQRLRRELTARLAASAKRQP